jgi:Mn-dependent DtxR family transcriptional regulator
MKNKESEEMYLETILRLNQKNVSVHSIDVATELNYSRPSVSRGVNLLQKKGYINFGKNGELLFTEAGEEKAKSIYERHLLLTKLLEFVGADKTLAEENACRIEHVISPEMFEILKTFSKKI